MNAPKKTFTERVSMIAAAILVALFFIGLVALGYWIANAIVGPWMREIFPVPSETTAGEVSTEAAPTPTDITLPPDRENCTVAIDTGGTCLITTTEDADPVACDARESETSSQPAEGHTVVPEDQRESNV